MSLKRFFFVFLLFGLFTFCTSLIPTHVQAQTATPTVTPTPTPTITPTATPTPTLTPTPSPTPVFVRTDGDDGTCNGLVNADSSAAPNCAFASLTQAITDMGAGGTIYIAAGTYAEDDILIDKALTIIGADPDTTIIKRSTIGGVTLQSTIKINNSIADADNQIVLENIQIATDPIAEYDDYPILIMSSYTTLTGCIIDSTGDTGYGIKANTDDLTYITFDANTFLFDDSDTLVPGDQVIDFYSITNTASNITITDNIFTASGTNDFALRLGAVNTTLIQGNTLGSRIVFYLPAANNISNVTVLDNNFEPTLPGTTTQGGIYFEQAAGASTITSVDISYNDFTNNDYGVAFDSNLDDTRVSLSSVTIENNNFVGNDNGTTPYDKAVVLGFTPSSGTLNAEHNWWNTTTGPNTDGDSASSYVDFDPYFANAALTLLSDGSFSDLILASTATGQVALASGQTTVNLYPSTALDMTVGISTAVSGTLTIDGTDLTLSSFTSGSLTSVDLSASQTVGDTTVTITKGVQLDSGTVGEAITLTSTSDTTNVRVSIPDQTVILGPSGWDGKIKAPSIHELTSTETFPNDYEAGGSVILLGSSSVDLLLDKAVTLTFVGSTGYIGFRSAGSTAWTLISDTCAGTYDSPTAPTFPGTCYIRGTEDTKVLTYHFSYFSAFNKISERGSGGGSNTSIDNQTCSLPKPGVPDFFEVRAKRNSATLLYTTVKEAMTDYYVIYGFLPGDERYAFSYSAAPSDGSMWAITIDHLQSGKPYYFKMRAGNGCAPGEWSGWLGGKTPRYGYSTYKYFKYH